MKKTQRKIVEEKLEQEGKVENIWAVNNFMLRLGAIIHQMRKDGWVIETKMEGQNHNHGVYYLKSKPQ